MIDQQIGEKIIDEKTGDEDKNSDLSIRTKKREIEMNKLFYKIKTLVEMIELDAVVVIFGLESTNSLFDHQSINQSINCRSICWSICMQTRVLQIDFCGEIHKNKQELWRENNLALLFARTLRSEYENFRSSESEEVRVSFFKYVPWTGNNRNLISNIVS